MKQEIEKNNTDLVRNSGPIEMLRAAKEAGIEPKDMQGFLDVQINWEKREAEKEFNAAMARVHAKIQTVSKSAVNPQTKSRYAELDQIISKCKPIYTGEGFSVSFYEGENAPQNHIRICADILHELGHKITRHYDVPLDGVGIKGNANMTAIHGKASSTSYGRRYLMCMIFNIPTGDDNDGNNQNVPLITEEQAFKLEEWIEAVSADREKFLAYMKVESLEMIPASKYTIALNALKSKEKKK